MEYSDLDALEQRALDELATTKVTTTTVMLASDLWTRENRDDWGGDPVGLVGMIIESLGEKGLVTYRLAESRKYNEGAYYTGFPQQIRLTPEGWRIAGYPNRIDVVGSGSNRHRFHGPHGDRTKFTTHDHHAEGGPIEKMPFALHVAKYPHHPHPLWTTPEESDVLTRKYLRVTPEIEMEIIAAKAQFPLSSHAEIASLTNLPERTVAYVLGDLPRLRRTANMEKAQASLKQRIVWALEAMDFPDPQSLRLVLGRADTEHDIVHLLHSLHKEGRVDFDEQGPAKIPVRIHLTNYSSKRKSKEPPAMGISDPEPPAAVVSPLRDHPQKVAEPEPETAELTEWPELARLREQEDKRTAMDEAALHFIEAADLVRKDSPEAAAFLEEKAKAFSVTFPSPVELEYLQYATVNPSAIE